MFDCGLKFKPMKVNDSFIGLGSRTTALILNISAILKYVSSTSKVTLLVLVHSAFYQA